MKKVISLILISLVIMTLSVSVFATDVLGDGSTQITGNQYEDAQKNNTQNNTTTLPQTGAGDLEVGVLLVVCIASAIYAYKKVSDYRGI